MGGAMLCLSCINSKGAPHSHPCDIVDDNPPPKNAAKRSLLALPMNNWYPITWSFATAISNVTL
jgi:hypothetical protein